MAKKTIRQLTTGTFDFPDLIQDEECKYVDKTDLLYQLASPKKDAQFFISRPRRFGKSLMLSTLQAMFKGRRELFKGLKLDDRARGSGSGSRKGLRRPVARRRSARIPRRRQLRPREARHRRPARRTGKCDLDGERAFAARLEAAVVPVAVAVDQARVDDCAVCLVPADPTVQRHVNAAERLRGGATPEGGGRCAAGRAS